MQSGKLRTYTECGSRIWQTGQSEKLHHHQSRDFIEQFKSEEQKLSIGSTSVK